MKKYDKLCKSNSGITLLALVITIIVLIILAGISINLLLGENGLIKKAQNTKETHTIEAIKEKLDIAKGSDYIEQKGDSSIDTYFAILEKEKIEPYTITNKQKITTDKGIIEVDNKYSYIVTIENSNNIKIEYEGKIDEIIREPDEVTITITGEKEQANLPVTLNANVKINGEEVTSGKYIINTIAEEIGTEDDIYTKQITDSSIDVTLETTDTYYIHTLTTSKYGKKQETIKGPIQITTNYHQHEGSSSSGGKCYVGKTTRCTGENIVIQAIREGDLSKAYFTTRCNKCGNTVAGQLGTNYAYIGQACGTCGKIIQSGYVLNCGKTETTIESYTISY